MVVAPYEFARFPSDGGSISLKITREVSPGDGGVSVGNFELLVLVDTEFVKGSGYCYMDSSDLAEYAAFLAALDRGESASWRRGKKGFGLFAEVVVDESFGHSYEEIRIVAVDDDSGVSAGVVTYREDGWLAEAKDALEILVDSYGGQGRAQARS